MIKAFNKRWNVRDLHSMGVDYLQIDSARLIAAESEASVLAGPEYQLLHELALLADELIEDRVAATESLRALASRLGGRKQASDYLGVPSDTFAKWVRTPGTVGHRVPSRAFATHIYLILAAECLGMKTPGPLTYPIRQLEAILSQLKDQASK